MFRFIVVVATLAVVVAFSPARFNGRSQMTMAAEKSNFAKMIGVALVASSLFSGAAIAKEGAGAKQSFFGDDAYSSPFTYSENREDPIYSPYSAYGDGSKAVYNQIRGDAKEVSFWKNVFANSEKRVDNVPKFTAKKEWSNINTELKSYAYNMRQSMNYLAAQSKNPTEATALAKAYFTDLNDIDVFSVMKKGDKVTAAYEKSVADLTAFKALLN